MPALASITCARHPAEPLGVAGPREDGRPGAVALPEEVARKEAPRKEALRPAAGEEEGEEDEGVAAARAVGRIRAAVAG